MAKLFPFYSQDPGFIPTEGWNSVYKYADTGRFLLTMSDCYRELYFIVSVA